MMKKKVISILLCVAMAMTMLTGCGGSDGTQGEKPDDGKGEEVEITYMNFLTQYTDQLNTIKEMYKKVKPNVKLNIEILGGDYNKVVQTRIATQQTPDLFMSAPYTGMDLFAEASSDMGDSSLWKVVDKEKYKDAVTSNGEIRGVPFMVQAYGILYNIDVFEQAGITKLPETLSELEEVCKTLEAKGIIPFAEGFKDNWTTGQLAEFPLSVNPDFRQRTADWVSGKSSFADDPIADKIFDMLDLTKKYMQDKPFDTDHMSSLAMVANGEAAMIQQGDWAVASMLSVKPDANIGMFPMPVSDDPSESHIFYEPGIVFSISKDTEHRAEVEEFLEWFYNDPEVRSIMIDDMKIMSPITGLAPTEESRVLVDAAKLIDEGKGANWGDYSLPPGLAQKLIAPVEQFLLGKMDRTAAIAEMAKLIAEHE